MDGHRLESYCEEETYLTPALAEPPTEHGELEVTLRDFVINCSPEDSVLDGMMVAVHGIRKEDASRTEKITPTTWKYHREIQLRLDMNEIILSVETEDSDIIGYVAFSKDELAAFMKLNNSTKLERDFMVLDENGASLELTCILGVSPKAPSTLQKCANPGPEWPYGLNMAVWFNNLGVALQTRFKRTGDLADIAKAITAQKTAVELTPEGHANMPVWLVNLAISFRSRFNRTGNLADLEHTIAAQQRAVDLTPQGHPNMPIWLDNLGISFQIRFNRTGNLEDIENAISTQQKAVDLTPEGHIYMPLWLSDLGLAFQIRFTCTGNLVDIERAISSQQKAISLAPENHANMPVWLNNLGLSFQRRFDRIGDLADLENSISIQRKAIILVSEVQGDLPVWLNNLALAFQLHFNRTGDLTDIENAISTQQRAIDLTPEGHTNLPLRLNNLGDAFQLRFNHTGNLADIKNAISIKQRAVDLTPQGHAKIPLWLSSLALSFQKRFDHTGDLTDLEKAVSIQQKAVDLTPEEDASMSLMLNNLGLSLRSRFNCTGDLVDLENAISIQKQVINHTPDGHASMPLRLDNLGVSLRMWFDRTGNLVDLETAISAQQKAVDFLPLGHASMSSILHNLAVSFRTRFDRIGNMEDIENAISTQKRAVDLTPDGHAEIPLRLEHLGQCFRTRFVRTGNLIDIENAISIQQKAIDLTPEGHANMPMRLNSLGDAFNIRFNHTSDLVDIDVAISTQQRAVDLTPEMHVDMPMWLDHLGGSLHRRFYHTNNPTDLENAISAQQKAVNLTPEGHASMSLRLDNLGVIFQTRFDRGGDLADIENAISAQQKAVDLIPKGHTDVFLYLHNLGVSFRTRFIRNGNLADIENAISIQQRAVNLAPEGHIDTSYLLLSLGHSFIAKFMKFHNTEDVHKAISILRRCATQITGHPSTRLKAARNWAQCSRVHDKSHLLDAFRIAVQLLPQVAGLEQIIPKRHHSLIDVSDVTASATAAAIDNGDLETALAWLEQGRCLVWNQINNLRAPAKDLQTHNSSLADRFLDVARALELAGSRQEQHSTFSEGNMEEMISLQEEVRAHVRLAKEWNDILQEIRRIPEFHDFLQPPQTSQLLSYLPPDCPIIIFNIHENRCDAFALISGLDLPIHIPLEKFSLQRAIYLRDGMRRYLTNHHVRHQQEVTRGTFRLDPHRIDIYQVLRELWEDVVKPILDALAYLSHPSDQRRIWWCPTGPLAFLPIHAAGVYSKEGAPTGPCISDYVVSSYTPTVSALLDKVKAIPTTDVKSTSLLIINQSQPSKLMPGLIPLSGAKRETHALRDTIGSSAKLLLLENAFATVSRVKEEMKTYSCVHFACHAIQDMADPLKSGVQLHDGRLEVLEMMRQTIPNADLAFLSACQTSTGDEKLADEVVHLAASMLAAGYRSVVATMWSIEDQHGPAIAKDFYQHILAANPEDGRLDGADAARALHHATQKLRKDLGDTEEALLIWVPYVHFGV